MMSERSSSSRATVVSLDLMTGAVSLRMADVKTSLSRDDKCDNGFSSRSGSISAHSIKDSSDLSCDSQSISMIELFLNVSGCKISYYSLFSAVGIIRWGLLRMMTHPCEEE